MKSAACDTRRKRQKERHFSAEDRMITLLLLIPVGGSHERKVDSACGTCLEEGVSPCLSGFPVHTDFSLLVFPIYPQCLPCDQ